MRLVAYLDEKQHGHILAGFWFSQFTEPEPKSVHFVIDSGCTTTTLLSDDVTLLGINCSALSTSTNPVTTANGQVFPFRILSPVLIFDTYFGLFNRRNKFRAFRLDEIHCHAPTNPQLMTPQRIENACSLLGMDFLSNFKTWKFRGNKLYLDT